MYQIDLEPGRTLYEGRYYNCNGATVAIVAVVTEGIDWAAYIGTGYRASESEGDTLRYVAKYGAKLSETDARYYFDIEMPYQD